MESVKLREVGGFFGRAKNQEPTNQNQELGSKNKESGIKNQETKNQVSYQTGRAGSVLQRLRLGKIDLGYSGLFLGCRVTLKGLQMPS